MRLPRLGVAARMGLAAWASGIEYFAAYVGGGDGVCACDGVGTKRVRRHGHARGLHPGYVRDRGHGHHAAKPGVSASV